MRYILRILEQLSNPDTQLKPDTLELGANELLSQTVDGYPEYARQLLFAYARMLRIDQGFYNVTTTDKNDSDLIDALEELEYAIQNSAHFNLADAGIHQLVYGLLAKVLKRSNDYLNPKSLEILITQDELKNLNNHRYQGLIEKSLRELLESLKDLTELSEPSDKISRTRRYAVRRIYENARKIQSSNSTQVAIADFAPFGSNNGEETIFTMWLINVGPGLARNVFPDWQISRDPILEQGHVWEMTIQKGMDVEIEYSCCPSIEGSLQYMIDFSEKSSFPSELILEPGQGEPVKIIIRERTSKDSPKLSIRTPVCSEVQTQSLEEPFCLHIRLSYQDEQGTTYEQTQPDIIRVNIHER